ncbi:MAG TPA: site-2 protease family protein [Burkholderiales bacterium]|nr:site-2 protease family protein [Burkholderiales bacterium]
MIAAALLPALREELDLMPGPRQADGQPTWTLHDPVRNAFFQLDWASFEILQRWSLQDPAAIAADVAAETTLAVGAEDVQAFAGFLQQNQLLEVPPGTAAHLAQRVAVSRGGYLTWLLHNYLFFRIPLARPDAFLARWAPRLGFLFSRRFLQLTVLAGVLGIAGVYRSLEQFSTTLVDLLSWQGAVAYGATLIAVKTLHELGHGFTAKRYGCRVPTMGVAFLVMWPVAYTDTNDVWKLTRRSQRLEVAAAGILTELGIAVWATFAWVWLPDGLPRTIAFLLSTTTWVSTVLINASPFMRFDGYFLLADALQVPNLHARAFALARWHLREALFGLGEPPPEHFARRKAAGLILFAWVTWIYRLVLFLGIAVLVYHFFIKAVGIVLFAVEIAWFIVLPVWRELKAWAGRWTRLRGNSRTRRTVLIGALAVGAFIVPWPARVSTSGLLEPADQWAIYAPPHARVRALPYADGATVPEGAVVIALDSPALRTRTEQNDARRSRLAWESASAGFDAETRKDWRVLHEELTTARAEKATIAADAARYRPRAPFAGVLRDLEPDLRPGDWVGEGEMLGRLVREGPMHVVTYVEERDIHRIKAGDHALFSAEGLDGPVLELEVAEIEKDAARTLDEPELATLFGGHVLVREKAGVLYPERAVYRVVLTAAPGALREQHRWRGHVTIAGRWEAPFERFVRSGLSVLWRELGF